MLLSFLNKIRYTTIAIPNCSAMPRFDPAQSGLKTIVLREKLVDLFKQLAIA